MASDVTLEDLRSMDADYYFAVISITIAVYDYCLTFASEVERFWMGGPLNWASGLFYMNRYLVLFGHIPVMIEYFWSTSNPEKIKMLVNTYYSLLGALSPGLSAKAIQVIVASMLVMRMYALYERSRRVLTLYFAVCTLVVGIGLWAVLGGKSQKPREVLIPLGCGASLTHNQAIRLGAAWAGMLAFDSLVFGMTLYKSLSHARTPGANLLAILLRDGTIYFAVMMASNLGNILTFVFGGPLTRGAATTFTNVISSVMISRLMLNLRNPALVRHAPKSAGSREDSTYPNLTFVEPILSTMQPDWDAAGEEDAEQSRRGADMPGGGGRRTRGRDVYEYLALGSSSRRNNRDIEMLALKLKDRPEALS